MTHPPTQCAIEVDPADVLWFTRGRDWDYVFALQPTRVFDEDWFTLQWKIFRDLVADSRPQHVAGTVWRRGSAHPYLATLFLDPARTGPNGLPVVHRLVWFPPDESVPRTAAPADWGPRFVAALGPSLDAVTVASAATDRRSGDAKTVRRLMAEELAELVRPLRLEGPAVMIYVEHTVARWVRREPDVAPRLSDAPARHPTRLELGLISAAIVAVLLALVLIIARGL